ncbi:DUF2845 domain-containing protein [Dyella sp. M7H15-1]|uniref:DUF2845 domain-containing protein n=1 Tax=Dyella sp. M7H15-1 TaxID=2501295 RepID=UPI001004E53D|nr:DUF2845 domain-containing protein [Dyella sp. M7H15-1]QAU24747.1 DUF2845 domain-containing protein [Dyella sp. M7H15-1]
MRRYPLFVILLVCSASAHALESLRVGNQLVVVGDSAAKVKALMGNPSTRTKSSSGKSSSKVKTTSPSVSKSKRQEAKEKGETWQYQRDGHTTIFTMAHGKITHIEDVAR